MNLEARFMASKSRRRGLMTLLGCGLLCLATAPAMAAGPIRVLIVDGQNNHDWKKMTPPMKADLEASGRFAVDVATTPPAKSPASAWEG